DLAGVSRRRVHELAVPREHPLSELERAPQHAAAEDDTSGIEERHRVGDDEAEERRDLVPERGRVGVAALDGGVEVTGVYVRRVAAAGVEGERGRTRRQLGAHAVREVPAARVGLDAAALPAAAEARRRPEDDLAVTDLARDAARAGHEAAAGDGAAADAGAG